MECAMKSLRDMRQKMVGMSECRVVIRRGGQYDTSEMHTEI